MIDVLYLCHGRLEFTKASLLNLYERTDWLLVNDLLIYNDATPENNHQTARWLQSFIDEHPIDAKVVYRATNLGSPVAVMNHYLNRSSAPLFAKIDNDIIVPSGWLEALAQVMDDNPEIDLLGAEPGMSGVTPLADPNSTPIYGCIECSHIGGVGLMRRRAFERYGYPTANGRFGFTEWQHEHLPRRAWVQPDLLLFALDRLPVEPWRTITEGYKAREGLQRNWPLYDPKFGAQHYEWWTG